MKYTIKALVALLVLGMLCIASVPASQAAPELVNRKISGV